MSTVVFYCLCHSDSASVLLHFTLMIHYFQLKEMHSNLLMVIICILPYYFIFFIFEIVYPDYLYIFHISTDNNGSL